MNYYLPLASNKLTLLNRDEVLTKTVLFNGRLYAPGFDHQYADDLAQIIRDTQAELASLKDSLGQEKDQAQKKKFEQLIREGENSLTSLENDLSIALGPEYRRINVQQVSCQVLDDYQDHHHRRNSFINEALAKYPVVQCERLNGNYCVMGFVE